MYKRQLFDLEVNLLFAVLYAAFAFEVRNGTSPARSTAGLGVAAIVAYVLARKVAHLRAMRRLGLLAHCARDPFNLVDWLAVACAVATFAVGALARRDRALDRVCAFSALVLAVKFLLFLRQLSVQLARFVRALLMIVRDIASFVVVLVIALLGFGEALYFILAPRADELDDGEPHPFETPQLSLIHI